MAPAKGSQWSKDPLRDRLEDELAIDLEIADMLDRVAAVLRSRRPTRAELAKPSTPRTGSASPLERRSA
jgi:hypothetical protein